MKNLTLQNITEACSGTLLAVNGEALPSAEATGVVIDSRKLTPGNLFIAIVGERVDGHRFVPQVLENGAIAAVIEKMPEKVTGPLILVKSTEQALRDIAAYYRSCLDLTVVGITGSVGKTSTKETIASVLAEKYRVLATEGNFNNEIGLPLTIFRLTEEHEVAVLEMGISNFGEMERLSAIAQPDIAVITNIGDCHLEFLGDRDGVLCAKTEIFEHLKKSGAVALNGDDEKLKTVREVNGRHPLFFGTEESDPVRATEMTPKGLSGIAMKLTLPDLTAKTETTLPVTIHVPGRHNVYNALAAAAVGVLLHLSPEEIAHGIENYRTIGGRSNVIETKKWTIIDDCYNANPISMREAIATLDLAEGRKIAVLGDMGELGEDEEKLHREVGAYLADTGIALVFCAGELTAYLASEVKRLAPEKDVRHFADRDTLLDALLPILHPRDTVLVKASHFMEFSVIVEKLQSF